MQICTHPTNQILSCSRKQANGFNNNLYFSQRLLLYNCTSLHCCASYTIILKLQGILTKRRGKDMAEAKGGQMEIANKRVALTPSTWAALSNIKTPGKSLGDTVSDLITEHQRRTLERDLDEIDANGQFIPWEKAKKELGL
jgi:hypothetical protein